VLYTDASELAVGAVLSQHQNGREIVIAYWSRQLTKPEHNYSTIEREVLAVVGAIREFYPYLYGFQFKLVTDHNPLTSLRNIKDVGGRLTRWMLYLQQFEFTWEHRAGKNHSNADTLSRIASPNSVLGVFHQLSPPVANIKAAQQTDKLLSPIISALNSNSPLPTDVPPGLKRVALKEGVLCVLIFCEVVVRHSVTGITNCK